VLSCNIDAFFRRDAVIAPRTTELVCFASMKMEKTVGSVKAE